MHEAAVCKKKTQLYTSICPMSLPLKAKEGTLAPALRCADPVSLQVSAAAYLSLAPSQLHPPQGSNCRSLPQTHTRLVLQTIKEGKSGERGTGQRRAVRPPTRRTAVACQGTAEPGWRGRSPAQQRAPAHAQLDASPVPWSSVCFGHSPCSVFTFHNLSLFRVPRVTRCLAWFLRLRKAFAISTSLCKAGG